MRAILAAACLVLAAPSAFANSGPRYRITADEAGEIHRMVEVRIERRQTEAELKAIAKAIQEREARPFRRTLVNFYLPSMKPGHGAWATATHTKDITVRIVGLRVDEEETYTAEARADNRNLVGTWLTSTPAAPGRLTIYRERGKLFAEWRLRNGTKTTDEVVESRAGNGRRFDNRPTTAEHYVLVSGGELELRQGDQLVAVAEAIRMTPDKAAPVAHVAPGGQSAEVRAASVVPARVPRGRVTVEAPADPDVPQALAPRAAAAVAIEERTLRAPDARSQDAKVQAARFQDAAPVEAAEKRNEKTQKVAEEAPRRKPGAPVAPRQRPQPSSGGTIKSAGGDNAQERIVSKLFRGQYATY